MKDSTPSTFDEAGLDKSYQQHRDAYIKIFDRLGFHYVIVQAMAGAMGGSKSEEFLHRGERRGHLRPLCQLWVCRERRGRAGRRPDPIPYADLPASHVEDTPDTPTIETLCHAPEFSLPREDRAWLPGTPLKNVVVMLVHPDGSCAPLVIGIPGDRDVDEKRLRTGGASGRRGFEEADFAAPLVEEGVHRTGGARRGQ